MANRKTTLESVMTRRRFIELTALVRFDGYDRWLAGNPNITFFKGVAHEGMGVKKSAAEQYYRYLQAVNQGGNAQYAYNRPVGWGYIKSQQQ